MLTTLLQGIIRARFGPFATSGEINARFGEEKWYISKLEYRNVAPLYAGEPMTICVQRKITLQPGQTEKDVNLKEAAYEEDEAETEKVYKLWIEGPNGIVSVKATATVRLRETEDTVTPRGVGTDILGTSIAFGAMAALFD
jgi:hypothetical protein